MMHKPVKTAILGTGDWATMCLRALRLAHGIELVACHGPDPEALARFAAESGLPPMSSEEALLDIPGLEAVLLLTPNHVHCRQAVAAAGRGLHVYVEKPMALNVDECRLMIETAGKHRVVLFVGHNTRREARFRHVAGMISRGDIGSVGFASITFTSPAGLTSDKSNWRYDKELVPSPGLVQIGVHAIDVMHALFGPTTSVQAWMRDGDLQDVCLACLQFPDGLGAHLATSYTVKRLRELQVMGSGGKLFSESESSIVVQLADDRTPRVIGVERNDTVLEEFEEFAVCCRAGKQPLTGGREGLQAVAVMDAILQSVRENGRACPTAARP